MIQVNIKNLSSLTNKSFKRDIQIIPTNIINQLNEMELPISNKEKAIKNISNFLSFLNSQYQKYNTTLLPIDVFIFIKFFNNRLYKQYRDILQELNIISPVPYENGTFYSREEGLSMQYRIHNSYLKADDFTLLFFKKGRNVKRDIKIECNVNNVMLNTILNTDLDYKKVFDEEIKYHKENNTSNFSLYIRLSRALSIDNTRYIKQGSKVDRIFHSFSNLSKVTRKCFDTEFFELDMVNAQPMLLAVKMRKEKIEIEEEYIKICEEGMFYELFENVLVNRDDIKTECYSSIFFDFKENRDVNKKFRELFPKIWNYLKFIKNNKIKMASLLQNEEAEIFNNIKVRHSSKFFTLFDAVVFNNVKDEEYISKQILDYGKKYGIKFKLK